MIASSRPLRFLVLLVGMWVTMRTAQLWPSPDAVPAATPRLLEAITPVAAAEPSLEIVARTDRPPPHRLPEAARRNASSMPVASGLRGTGVATPVRGPVRVTPALTAIAAAEPERMVRGPIGSPLPATPVASAGARFRASLWTIVRGGGAASPFAPQLGGSQAGVRLTYAIDDARRVALAARLSTALGTRQREAAIGIDWRPTALPVHLVAEQRIGIQGVRGGPSVAVIAGVAPAPVAAGFSVEAYAQAGGIARDGRVEGYADGAARVARPVPAGGAARIDLGLGAWGGAQRGAARLDVGPTASASLPVGGTAVRFSLDWRQRIAGDARPGSGPALSIGTDF